MTFAVLLQESLAALGIIELSNVSFGPLHAQLDFSGEFNVSLRIDKDIDLLNEANVTETIDIETKKTMNRRENWFRLLAQRFAL